MSSPPQPKQINNNGGAEEANSDDEQPRDASLLCRYYEREYPEVDECVLVTVKSIAEMGAYVTLIEYNNIEGMILLSELSRRRIRSVNKLIRVGKTEIAMVMRVDEQKGYIDLSKRRVTPEDAMKCEERFNKAKAVNSIMRQVAQISGKSLLEVNRLIAWPLAANHTFKSSYDALRHCLVDPDAVFSSLGNVDPYLLQLVISNVKKRLTPQAIKIRADIEVSCFTYEGIDVVRAALMEGKKVGEDIQIKLIAPPLYVMLTQATDKQVGIALLEKAIKTIGSVCEAKGGKMTIKNPPRATSTQEENALANLLEQMEEDNREVDGDDDEDNEISDRGIRKEKEVAEEDTGFEEEE